MLYVNQTKRFMTMTAKQRNILAVVTMSTTLLFSGCGAKTDCVTAKDFIEAYSKAYQSGDAKAVMKMRAGIGLLEKMDIDPALKEELADYSLEKETKELEESLERDDMWARAWKNTEYRSERAHGGHIHVEVAVNGIPSAVVLVRDGEFLRIHPRPSWFD